MTSAVRVGGFFQCRYFADKAGGGSSEADAKNCCKKLRFSKFMMCPHGQVGRGVEPVRTFFGQMRRVSIFRDFVQMSVMDGPV